MNINLLYLILLVLGFPAGIMLAKMCKDEMRLWKIRLVIISIISLFLAIIISFIPINLYLYKFPTIIALFFIIITSLTIIWKSEENVKTKKSNKRKNKDKNKKLRR